MSSKKYSMAFSSGGLLYNESLLVLDVYLQVKDWGVTRKSIIDANTLQSRTLGSEKRKVGEIISRISLLTSKQLDLLETGSNEEQRYLLWLAVCKRYLLIYEFALEVIQEKYLRMDLPLSREEYDLFFEYKAEWYEEFERVKPSTRKKTRQTLFQIMREAQILSTENLIIPAIPSGSFLQCVMADNQKWLRAFPVSEAEIKRRLI